MVLKITFQIGRLAAGSKKYPSLGCILEKTRLKIIA